MRPSPLELQVEPNSLIRKSNTLDSVEIQQVACVDGPPSEACLANVAALDNHKCCRTTSFNIHPHIALPPSA